jgi:glucose-6-phosphate isomerase
MTSQNLYTGESWKKLMAQAEVMNLPQSHLKHLIAEPDRLNTFSLTAADVLFDFSRQRIDSITLELLFELARTREVLKKFAGMTKGERLNLTEDRAALHTATRDFSSTSLYLDGKDILSELREVNRQIKAFSDQVHSGMICGSTGKRFRHVVVIGIGGSYLGTEFVSTALKSYADRGIDLYYLSNVDIHNFGAIVREIDLEATLWLIISKSYTTAETLSNEGLARAFMTEKGIDPSKHIVTVTSKGSPGDSPANPVLQSFNMFDFIGGRYSVSSAVGAVPLSLYFGYEIFERFLKGAETMDSHALDAPVHKNMPLVAALIAIWNNNFLKYPAQAIIPYSAPLAKLAPHVQQLNMESNGKMVNTEGIFMKEPCGTIIFGEPGTNAQHSFFQLAHQGRAFPIEFIGVIHPQFPQYRTLSKGVTNHQELWANLLSQPMALATGKEDADPARCFPGNRPSSTLILKDLSPESVGKLLSFYEARTVFEAFIWGINPFDQFGVELGKVLAGEIRKEMAARNQDSAHSSESIDPITRFYLEMLFLKD